MSTVPSRPAELRAELLPHEGAELRVLLVEDDDGDALIFEDLLAQAKPWASLRRAGTVAAAEAQLDAADCVILDLGLPDVTGLDGLRRIARRTHDIPIIVLTGDVDDRRGIDAVAAGAQDYLVKGAVDPPTLRRSIRYAIERCRAEASERKLHDAELYARENARLERGLLPRPVIADARITVHSGSRPGRARSLLGGDFFDVVETADGTLHAIIGDVSGHGPDEAALGVCLRVAWRALVLSGADPSDALAGIEEVLVHERMHDEQFATAASVCTGPDRGGATLHVAGHPAPVLLVAGHQPEVLSVQAGPPLGVLPGHAPKATEVGLPAAWSMLLYTDGLLEGHVDGGPGRLGQDRLVQILGHVHDAGDPGALIGRVIARVESENDGPLADDVAAVLLEVAGG